MSHALYRLNANYTIPEVAGRPARAGYSYFVIDYVQQVTLGPAPGGWGYRQVPVTDAFGRTTTHLQLVYLGTLAAGSGVSTAISPQGSTTTQVTRRVDVPADPGIPGSAPVKVVSPPTGWTAFAHSVESIRSAGYCEFKVPSGVSGVAVGFTTNSGVPKPGYAHIPHGLVFTDGKVKNLRTGATYGTFDSDDVFRIRVTTSLVEFSQNGSGLGSEASTYPRITTLWMGAAMYAAGDFLYDPEIVEEAPAGFAALEIEDFQVYAYQTAITQGLLFIDDFRVFSQPANEAMLEIDFAVFAGDRLDWSGAAIVIEDFEVSAYGGTVDVVLATVGDLLMDDFMVSGFILSGTYGEAALVMDDFIVIGSSIPGAIGAIVMEDFGVLAFQEPNTEAYMYETFHSNNTLTSSNLMNAEMFTAVVVADSMAAARLLDALMHTDVQVADSIVASMTTDAFMVTIVRMGDALNSVIVGGPNTDQDGGTPPGVVDDGSETWVLNVATGGSTEYTNYGFNSYARIGDKYFGASDDGLVELSGPDDRGTPIHASFSLGMVDAGNAQRKIFSHCYLGVSSQGTMFVKVRVLDETTDEYEEYVYEARDFSEKLKQQRITLGKGMKANYIGLEIYNSEGADFELDSVEFLVAELKRKI